MRATPWLLLATAAPLLAQQPSARAADDTVPTLRWRLLGRALVREVESRRKVAQLAAVKGDSAALEALPPAAALDRTNLLRSLAYYQAAESARVDPAEPSVRAAAAAAAAASMRRGFPEAAPRIDQELARDSAAEIARGVSQARVLAGLHLGRAVAAQVLERAKGDGWDKRWDGTVPTGPGRWYGRPNAPIGNANFVLRRPLALASIDQFRPPPPPAFGTPAFDSALAEVREVARTRTAEQTRIAQYWGAGQDQWAERLVDVIEKRRVPEETAMRLQTALAVGENDVGAACWEAKMHYWLIRPSQADTTIALATQLSLPNFPAYPSGHACWSGFLSEVIGHYVPEARDEVRRLAEEAALSRLYAGLHYRFDNDAGLELGRKVARYVIEQEESGKLRRKWR
ncbi:MAG TPA: vanadium-dependent haloperoxidase [Gemmatimonadaceae bacterium]|nr:vanadium-dependent haloperoxidase [Gemmatimonadaceae bacterium]